MNNAVLYKILRWTTVVLAVVFLIVISGNSRDTEATFAQIETAVSGQVDLSLMQKADPDKLNRFYGLDAAQFKNCILYYPTDFMGVEEVLLIEMTDISQKDVIVSAIEARLARQKETFDGYGSDGQYEKLCNNAVTEVRGNFLFFAVNSDAPLQAFLKTVQEG